MPKDKQAIQKMAEIAIPLNEEDKDYIAFAEHDRKNWVNGYTAAVEDMEKEVIGFAEWRDNNITRAWIEKDGVKLWKVRRTDFVGEYKTTADLLTLYRESIKK